MRTPNTGARPPLRVGDPVRIDGMPDRSGRIDRISTAPGETIARVNDHWYLASAVIR